MQITKPAVHAVRWKRPYNVALIKCLFVAMALAASSDRLLLCLFSFGCVGAALYTKQYYALQNCIIRLMQRVTHGRCTRTTDKIALWRSWLTLALAISLNNWLRFMRKRTSMLSWYMVMILSHHNISLEWQENSWMKFADGRVCKHRNHIIV